MSDKSTKRKERDERIYWAVRGEGRSQRDVAREFELTQPRVCQIVRDVSAHFDQTMPGLAERLAEAGQVARIGRETLERRQRLIDWAEDEYKASKQPLTTTIEKRMQGEKDWNQTIRRDQRGDVRLLKIMQQENDRLASWAERQAIANCKLQTAKYKVPDDNLQFAMESDGTTTAGQASSGTQSLPMPTRLRPEDRELWATLSPSEQELAAKRLAIRDWPLDWARLDDQSPEFVFYPYRSEGEMSSCMLAEVVVRGGLTPAEYIQRMEQQELSKPLVSPLALARVEEDWEGDVREGKAPAEPSSATAGLPSSGVGQPPRAEALLDEPAVAPSTPHSALPRRWRLRERDELRPPSHLAQRLLFEGRHAQDLDAATQAEVYQPYLSRAEYYATLRREMLGDGMLSPEEFGSLSIWASQLPGGLPAEGVTADGRLINLAGATAGSSSSGPASAIANCQVQTATCQVAGNDNLQFAIPALQFAMDRIPAAHGSAGASPSQAMEPLAGQSTAGPAGSGTRTSTRQRLLAAGKPLSDRTRARWERKIERRQDRIRATSTGCPRAVDFAR